MENQNNIQHIESTTINGRTVRTAPAVARSNYSVYHGSSPITGFSVAI